MTNRCPIHEDDALVATLTRSTPMANTARQVMREAGSEVIVSATAIESGRPLVTVYVPGTRYSALVPLSRIVPA